ncbi:hypothetical protein [Miltoncostaea marina]|uniref:hypothetical protein n=1 Tax=Miltoncostaea marina TaxID=2843215 RepID=UPI001C3E3ACD|nr:hypothetical protein [Miltoncostaea marina]
MKRRALVALVLAALFTGAAHQASAVTVLGTRGVDVLNGGPRADYLRGGPGADVLKGARGNDKLYGGPGADLLIGGAGTDRFYGGPGRDTIRAKDGRRDFVSCGPGVDRAFVDRADTVARDCERVTGQVPPGPVVTPVGGPVPPAAPTPPPPPPPAPGSTRATAVPIGQGLAIHGGWAAAVLSVTPDATAAVLAENQFNDPPAPGRQFFIARVSATYTGAASSRFDAGFRLRVVGPSAVAYTTFGDSCGVIPDDIEDPEVFTGGTITGNVCWSVPSGDVGGLVMFDSPLAFNYPPAYWRLF